MKKAADMSRQQKQLNKECRSFLVAESLVIGEKLKVASARLTQSSEFIIRGLIVAKMLVMVLQ